MICCTPRKTPSKKKKKAVHGCGSVDDQARHLNLLMTKPDEIVTKDGKEVQIYHF